MTKPDLKLGTFLPTTASEEGVWKRPQDHLEAAQHAESLGFDSLWMGDHYLTSPVHFESWLDPMTMLAYLAAGTETITLGPAILVAPVRQPVWLAKQASTLQYVSGGRFALCIATGFSPIEFSAVQVPLGERGQRQNEIQAIMHGLLHGERFEFHGKYYDFPEIIIEPVSATPVPVLVAGGSQPDHAKPISDSVVDRLARGDGWVTPTFAPIPTIAADWQRIRAARERMGLSGRPFTFAHMNFVHVVETGDDEAAYAEQEPIFHHHFGDHRSWSVIKEGHLVGGIDSIVEKVKERVDLGCNHICLQTVVREPERVSRQWELLTKHVLPQVKAHANDSQDN